MPFGWGEDGKRKKITGESRLTHPSSSSPQDAAKSRRHPEGSHLVSSYTDTPEWQRLFPTEKGYTQSEAKTAAINDFVSDNRGVNPKNVEIVETYVQNDRYYVVVKEKGFRKKPSTKGPY